MQPQPGKTAAQYLGDLKAIIDSDLTGFDAGVKILNAGAFHDGTGAYKTGGFPAK